MATVTPSAAPAGPAGQIAFVSNRDGHDNIYLMNEDGSGVEQLTHNDASHRDLVWSPDGGRLAYTTLDAVDESGIITAAHISTLAVGTGGETNLTPGLDRSSEPAWSADGLRIAFTELVVPGGGGEQEIFLVDASGEAAPHQLTDYGQGSFGCSMPVWGADGKTIIVYCQGLMIGGFQIVDAATGAMTPFPVTEPGSAFSAVGTDGAFAAENKGSIVLADSLRPDSPPHYFIPADGDGAPIYDVVGFAWSPVDANLLAARRIDSLIVANAGASTFTTLAEGLAFSNVQPAIELPPYPPVVGYPSALSWSPDGRQIVFVAWVDGSEEIFVATLDKPGRAVRLTTDPATDYQPAWRP
jgi:dipeptidyl aminopeptidase/acylaminoacyl peptidase